MDTKQETQGSVKREEKSHSFSYILTLHTCNNTQTMSWRNRPLVRLALVAAAVAIILFAPASASPTTKPSTSPTRDPSSFLLQHDGPWLACAWLVKKPSKTFNRCDQRAVDSGGAGGVAKVAELCPQECWAFRAATATYDEPRLDGGKDGDGDSEGRDYSYRNYRRVDPSGYEIDDVIIAAVVMTSDRLPLNPAFEDCQPAFQEAFEEAAAMGGGIVYVPPGHYAFYNPMVLPSNVVLRGSVGDIDGADKRVRGTVLRVYYDGRETNHDAAFLRLFLRSGLKDLTIWYPNQSIRNVIPYSRTIDGLLRDRAEEMHIENVHLVNSYIGLSIEGNAKRLFVRGLFGSPLQTGIVQRTSSDIPFYSNVSFGPDYWSGSGLPGSPYRSDLVNYLQRYATGIKFGSSDNIFASNLRVSGYRIGFHFVAGPGGTSVNGNMYGLEARDCGIGLHAESIGPTFIIESTFEGTVAAAMVTNKNVIGVQFQSCSFLGKFECTWLGRMPRNLRFQSCSFGSTFHAGSSRVFVVDSKFLHSDGPPIHLDQFTGDVSLVGNDFSYDDYPVARSDFVSTSRILLDDRPTNSSTYVPFPIEKYNKACKPAASNLIVINQGPGDYSAAVDGVTDDALVIQRALNDISAKGGGTVFLPPISEKGYAIRSPIHVPSGCELRSTSEYLHSFNGWRRHEKVAGALLQIYHGRSADEPTITLNEGSGFLGFTIHYPEHFMDDIIPYSVTIKVTGNNSYIKNLQFMNSYDVIHWDNVEGFLAENILLQHIHRPFQISSSSNGRINHAMIRDEWDDSRFNTVTAYNYADLFSVENCVAYAIENSPNIEIFGTFTRLSNWLANVTNSTVTSLQFKMEASQNGVQVNGGNLTMIGTSLRAKDSIQNQKPTVFDVSRGLGDNNSTLQIFSALIEGHPDTIVKAKDADVLIQNAAFQLSNERPPSRGIDLFGDGGGVVRIENSLFDGTFITTSMTQADGKRLEIIANLFVDGVDYFNYFTYRPDLTADSTPDLRSIANSSTYLEDAGLIEAANSATRVICAPMGTEDPVNSGLLLKTLDYDLETKERRIFGVRTFLNNGYVPTGYPAELLFEVTSTPFIGIDPSDALIKFFYYDWEPGLVSVEYKLAGEGDYWKIAKEIVLDGDNGFVFDDDNSRRIAGVSRVNPYFFQAAVNVEGSIFQLGSEVRLTVKQGKAIFMYISIEEQPKTTCQAVIDPEVEDTLCWPDAPSSAPSLYPSARPSDCTCSCDWQCYLDRYADLQNAFGATNTGAAYQHYYWYGRAEGRDCTCEDCCT